MSSVQIEWGDLERSDAIEECVYEHSEKILTIAPEATKLVVHFQIINAHHSSGVPVQKVSLELRLPNNQDIRAEQEGSDVYQGIREAKKALLSQLSGRRKGFQRSRLSDLDQEEMTR